MYATPLPRSAAIAAVSYSYVLPAHIFWRCFTSCGVSSCPSNFCSAVWAGCFGTEPNKKQYQSHPECVSFGGLDSPVVRGPTSFRIGSNASSWPMVWTRQVKGRTTKTTSLLKQQCITVAYTFIQLLLKGLVNGVSRVLQKNFSVNFHGTRTLSFARFSTSQSLDFFCEAMSYSWFFARSLIDIKEKRPEIRSGDGGK